MISQTVFVDAELGNDQTGVINDLSRPFRTFDAAYLAIPDRLIPFNISLSPGDYTNQLPRYQNISVIATLGNNTIMPQVLVTENVQVWQGVIWTDIDLLFDVDPFFLREPITIELASRVNPSTTIYLNELTEEESMTKFGVMKKKRTIDDDISNKELIGAIKSAQQIELRSLFVSQRAFELLGAVIVNRAIVNFYTLIDVEDKAISTLPSSRDIGMFTGAFIREVGSIIFRDVERNQPSPLQQESTLNITLALIEAVSQAETTQVIVKELNLNISDLLSQALVSLLSDTANLGRKKRQIIPENTISEMIQREVEETFAMQQQQINQQSSFTPNIAFLDSSVTKNTDTFLTTDDLSYFVVNSNLSNIILPVEQKSVINIHGTEGSDINKGSQFTLYRKINNDYTHELLDGSVFLIDPKQDMTINLKIDKEWEGRIITYRRIDNDGYKVNIVNQSGLFDGCKRKLRLKQHLKLLIRGDGEALII